MGEAIRRGEEAPDPVILAGKKSSLRILWGDDSRTPDAPLVCASALGYSPLNSALRGTSDKAEVERLSDRLRDTQEGVFVSLVDGTNTRRPIVLIQADTSDGESQNFYEKNRPRPDRGIWRDFYFQTVLAAVREADNRWSPDEIELTHPTGGAWNRDLLVVSLEALGHLADTAYLTAKVVKLGCVHGVDEGDFTWAMGQLNREQRQNPQEFRDVLVREVDQGLVGIPIDVEGTVMRIEVEG